MFYSKALYFHSSFTLLGFSIGSGKLLGKPDELPWIACNRVASHPGWGRGGLGLGLTWEQKYIFCKFHKMWPLNLSNLTHNLLPFISCRERTHKVYQIFSRKPPTVVWQTLNSMKVTHVVVDIQWCRGRPK